MSHIVVGYDGLDSADGALDAALDLAKALGDEIVLVFGADPAGPGGGEVPTHRQAVQELAEKVTSAGLERAQKAGVATTVEMPAVPPAEALIATAEKHNARMIVVGSRGERPLKGVILGSTPYKLLHLSEVPVLVVPA